MHKFFILAILITLSNSSAMAQHAQPYAGMEQREVKALSKQQIDDLKIGRGMGSLVCAGDRADNHNHGE